MIVTCNTCPRQLCFAGNRLVPTVAAFGWTLRVGRIFCPGCAGGPAHG